MAIITIDNISSPARGFATRLKEETVSMEYFEEVFRACSSALRDLQDVSRLISIIEVRFSHFKEDRLPAPSFTIKGILSPYRADFLIKVSPSLLEQGPAPGVDWVYSYNKFDLSSLLQKKIKEGIAKRCNFVEEARATNKILSSIGVVV